MSQGILDLLAQECAVLLSPLVRRLRTPGSLQRLLDELGVPESAVPSLADALAPLADLHARLETLSAQTDLSFETVTAALDILRDAFAVLSALDRPGGAAATIPGLGRDLTELLLSAWLRSGHPVAYSLAALATLLKPASDQEWAAPVTNGNELLRLPFRIDRFHLTHLVELLRDPRTVLRSEYVNALATDEDAAAIADKLFPRLQSLAATLGITSAYGFHPRDELLLGDSAPLMKHSLVIYADDLLAGADAEAGAVLNISPASRGDLGFTINPFGALSFSRQVGAWSIETKLDGGLNGVAWGRHGLTLTTDTAGAEAAARISASFTPPSDAPVYVLGKPDGTRLEFGAARLLASAQLSGTQPSLLISAEVSSAALVLAASDGDGFVGDVLPAEGLRVPFTLGLAWSSDKGLTLLGSASLETTIPAGVSLGGVTLSAVNLALRASDGVISTEVSATVHASIGPVRAVLDRVGLRTALSMPSQGGNLGVADLSLGFKPPAGVGLAIDALGVLSGGGFLFHDEAQQLYGGAMQLSLHDQLTLTGFGLIATRMPDGSRGFSLIVFITAENFHPIPLGLGFNLLGIGGMVAIHRTFDEEAIRQGLKSGTLATLLFPRDSLGNVPALIQALTTAFPARRGSYLLGLLVKIGWLTPPLVLLDLALILELGARERLLVLGRIRAQLPSPQNEQIRLNMETLGVIDFDAGTAALDAVLVDSRLAYKFPITGGAALRANFGSASDANFVLAAGGLNPHFKRPRGFPSLDRLAISLSSGNNPRLVCEAYFAITSNTLQFGARAWLYASAAGFSVEGDVGFDVLVQVAPLHFIVDYHARVQLKRGSHNLFMVEVKGELEGPRPLRVSGKATFKILWFGFSVRFDTTLVHGDPPPLPPAVNVLAELIQALRAPESWSIQRPAHYPHGVALRSLPTGAGLVLDPLGQLAVKQQVVPLNTGQDIDIFAGAPVAGERRFALSAMIGQLALEPTPLQASFAPAQYFAMSDDEKLSAPPYQSMDAGYVFGTSEAVINAAKIVPAPLGYRTIVVTPDASASAASASAIATAAQPPSYTLTPEQLEIFTSSGAVARAPARRAGRARFQNRVVTSGDSLLAASVARGASFKPQRWTILPIDGRGPAETVAPDVRTWSEYQSVLNQLNRGGARWQLVPTYELEA